MLAALGRFTLVHHIIWILTVFGLEVKIFIPEILPVIPAEIEPGNTWSS